MISTHSIEVADRRRDAERFRRLHPVLRVQPPSWIPSTVGGRWEWSVALEAGPSFTSSLAIDMGEPADVAPAAELGAALALLDALSYWKAAVPTRLVFDGSLPGMKAWWDAMIANSMSEHLWRNGLDLDWLPALDGDFTDKPASASTDGPPLDAGTSLVLHSGGKDSITTVHLADRAGRRVRPVSYQPTTAMRRVVAASAPPAGWAGPPVTLQRRLDPALLDLNAAGYLNGHTPYSAWLAIAASAAADICGAGHVAAGNSRSDDEPNITAQRSTGDTWHINHQWTKSAEFEAAWAEICGPDRRYASPLRPLYELAVLAGLHADPLPQTDRALSCNRAAKAGRDGSWCGRCPKCLWTSAALDAIAGPGAGPRRLGLDPLADLANVELLTAMCGRAGLVPFECAGTPAEVRAILRDITDRPQRPAAVAALPAHLIEARPRQDAPTAHFVSDIGAAPLLDQPEVAAAKTWSITASHGLFTTTKPTAS